MMTVTEISEWPSGVANVCASYVPDGSVYVSDTLNHRIQVFGGDGTWIATWGSKGNAKEQFDTPMGCYSCFSTHFKTDLLYVCDSNNCRIHIFKSDGTFLNGFQFDVKPLTIAVDVDYSFLVSYKTELTNEKEAVFRFKYRTDQPHEIDMHDPFTSGSHCFGHYTDSGEPFSFWSIGVLQRNAGKNYYLKMTSRPSFLYVSGAVVHPEKRNLYVVDSKRDTLVVIPLGLFSP